MNKIIFCQKLKRELPGLANPPVKNELGDRIFNEISKAAWDLWLAHQTMLINEYRLSVIDPKAKLFLLSEMEKFLFGEGSEKPSGHIDIS